MLVDDGSGHRHTLARFVGQYDNWWLPYCRSAAKYALISGGDTHNKTCAGSVGIGKLLNTHMQRLELCADTVAFCRQVKL